MMISRRDFFWQGIRARGGRLGAARSGDGEGVAGIVENLEEEEGEWLGVCRGSWEVGKDGGNVEGKMELAERRGDGLTEMEGRGRRRWWCGDLAAAAAATAA